MDKLFNKRVDILQSTIQPNSMTTKYWADLSEDPNGGIVKFFNGTTWKNINFQDIENVKELQKNKIGREEVSNIITGVKDVVSSEITVDVNLNSYDTKSKKNNEISFELSSATEDSAGLLNTLGCHKLNSLPNRAVKFLEDSEKQWVELKDDTQEAIFSYEGIEIDGKDDTSLTYSKSIPCASTTNFGFMSKEDKINLEALIDKAQAGLEVNEIPEAESLYSYGVAWEEGSLNPSLIRIGNTDLHRSLPIQSKMRGCTLADDGTVNHYFKEDWSANEDGSTITLDGSDGMVMVEIPEFYMKAAKDGNIYSMSISEYPLEGFTKVKRQYISAFEATVDRGNQKLVSVVNATANYRGGSNQADLDGTDKSMLGFPATAIPRATFRNYARNRAEGYNWNMFDFISCNTIWLLFTIEYATFNSQLDINNTLSSEGFKQGGLGVGASTIADADWNTFNSHYPLIPCGASNSLGNNTGEVEYTLPASFKADTVVKVKVNRYRGIELPFGHIWKNVDGIIMDVKAEADGGTSKAFIAESEEFYGDALVAEYIEIGDIPRKDGYIADTYLGNIIPKKVEGASSTTGRCDYYYTNIASSSLRTLLYGGGASDGGYCGLGCFHSYGSVASSHARVGSRLVFRP